jgi:HSP20 family molecular chaperone IbpA
MPVNTLELMRDQVRAIYRVLTGTDLPEPPPDPTAGDGNSIPMEEVARRFADLERLVRTNPAVVERVPPFSFSPPLDAVDEGRHILIELAVPGVERGDLTVEATGELLVITGVRKGSPASNGRVYLHAEIPRGPFHRVVHLPAPINTEPRVEVVNGLVRIFLPKSTTTAAKA